MGDFRLTDLGLNKTIIQIKSINFTDILFQLIFFQDAGVVKEMKDTPLRGLHDIAKLFVAESPVPLKTDFFNIKLFILYNGEHNDNFFISPFF